MNQDEGLHQTAFPGARILIVDDERGARRTLVALFQRLGYRAQEAGTGEEALELLSDQPFDLVLLDLKMPGMDGSEVLRKARPVAPKTVFIILTAYGTLDSAIVGIRHGAFDYLLKPSPVAEIVRAVEAGLAERQRHEQEQDDPVVLLERALQQLKGEGEKPPQGAPPPGRFLQAQGVTVDVQRQLVVIDDHPLELTPTEFEILTYLMRRPESVVSCSELAFHLRGCKMDERDARVLLRSHIHRLRSKLQERRDSERLIHTVRGRGYVLSSNSHFRDG